MTGWGSGAFAQTPPAGQITPPAQTAVEDSETRLQPAEPDYRVVNLPTTLRLPLHGGNFTLTHRFNGDLTEGSFKDQLANLFGMDSGANMGLEFRYAVMRHVEAVFFRTNVSRAIQFTGKFDWWRQRGSLPVSISPIVAVEGQGNFSENFSTTLGATVSRNVRDKVAVYAVPLLVANSAAESGEYRNTFVLGIGGRARLRPKLYAVGEVSPRLGGYAPGQVEYAFGIETRVGGHVFQLNFANAQGTTFGQVARGGNPNSLYLGFNLSRKFF
jgi:hypothetical protein